MKVPGQPLVSTWDQFSAARRPLNFPLSAPSQQETTEKRTLGPDKISKRIFTNTPRREKVRPFLHSSTLCTQKSFA